MPTTTPTGRPTASRTVLKLLGAHFENPDGTLTFDGSYGTNLVGRVLSALFDVMTIVLVFELGRVLVDKRVGLLAAALLSLSVLNIQYSHFFGSETFLAFFVTGVLYFSVRITKYSSPWNYVGAGVAFGFALACKLSAIPLVLLPALAALITHVAPTRGRLHAVPGHGAAMAASGRARAPAPRLGQDGAAGPVRHADAGLRRPGVQDLRTLRLQRPRLLQCLQDQPQPEKGPPQPHWLATPGGHQPDQLLRLLAEVHCRPGGPA